MILSNSLLFCTLSSLKFSFQNVENDWPEVSGDERTGSFSPQLLLPSIDIQKRRADCKKIYFVHGIDKVNVHIISSLCGLFSLY